ncbi:hypothetical protein [Streptomyces sp. D2-8]|nr:hypothetical protein [Streptomyces sp. D2-8]
MVPTTLRNRLPRQEELLGQLKDEQALDHRDTVLMIVRPGSTGV